MARLLIADDTITIDMSGREKLEAAHADQAFPAARSLACGQYRTALPRFTA
jgi:hypothetical protein